MKRFTIGDKDTYDLAEARCHQIMLAYELDRDLPIYDGCIGEVPDHMLPEVTLPELMSYLTERGYTKEKIQACINHWIDSVEF